MDTDIAIAVYDERVKNDSWKVFLGIGVVIAIFIVLSVGTSPSPSELGSLVIFVALLCGFLWFVRPRPMRLTVTPADVVFAEGSTEVRIPRAEVARAVACTIRVPSRTRRPVFRPFAGQEAAFGAIEQGLEKAPPRPYGLRSGSGVAILRNNGEAVVFPTDAPERVLAALGSGPQA